MEILTLKRGSRCEQGTRGRTTQLHVIGSDDGKRKRRRRHNFNPHNAKSDFAKRGFAIGRDKICRNREAGKICHVSEE